MALRQTKKATSIEHAGWLRFSGIPELDYVPIPATVKNKFYLIENNTAHPLVIRYQDSGGLGVTIQPGTRRHVLCDGEDITDAFGSEYYEIQPDEEAAGVTVVDFGYPVLNVLRYGAKGNGISNDSAAIQAAANVAAVRGGTVEFPDGYIWGMGTQVNIASAFPVNLRMRASYVRPLANIAGSLFAYNCIGLRAGVIDGLVVFDDNNQGAVQEIDKRSFTMTAALDLQSFPGGVVRNARFLYVLGSAIRCGVVRNARISYEASYCGDTGKPAFVAATGGSNALVNTRVRATSHANFGAPHIELSAASARCRITGTFSGLASADETSEYVVLAGTCNRLSASFADRHATGFAVDVTGTRCAISNSTFELGEGRAVGFSGDHNQMRGGSITAATSSGEPLVFSGEGNAVTGVLFAQTPGIVIAGARTRIESCDFVGTLGASGYVIEVESTAVGTMLLENRVNSPTAGKNGFSLSASGVCSDNLLVGAGGGSTGIVVNHASVIVANNNVSSWSTQITPTLASYYANMHGNIGQQVRYAKGAAISVADGDFIPHGLPGTPATVRVTASLDGEFASVTAVNSSTFRVNIRSHDGNQGSLQTIYWEADL